MDLNKTDSQLTNIMEQDSPHKNSTNADTSKTASATTSSTSNVAPSRNVLRVTQTPRIDISRASSSSQHEDSRDSSPENVFDQVGTGTLQEGDAAGADLGFGEDGTNDLRSSTEELYFNESDDKAKVKVEQEKDWQTVC